MGRGGGNKIDRLEHLGGGGNGGKGRKARELIRVFRLGERGGQKEIDLSILGLVFVSLDVTLCLAAFPVALVWLGLAPHNNN